MHFPIKSNKSGMRRLLLSIIIIIKIFSITSLVPFPARRFHTLIRPTLPYRAKNVFPNFKLRFMKMREESIVDVLEVNSMYDNSQTVDLFSFPTTSLSLDKITGFIQYWSKQMRQIGDAMEFEDIDGGIKILFPVDPSIHVLLVTKREDQTTRIIAHLVNSLEKESEQDSSLQSLVFITINTLLESFVNEVNSKLLLQMNKENSPASSVAPTQQMPQTITSSEPSLSESDIELDNDLEGDIPNVDELNENAIPIDKLFSQKELQNLLWDEAEDDEDEEEGSVQDKEVLLKDQEEVLPQITSSDLTREVTPSVEDTNTKSTMSSDVGISGSSPSTEPGDDSSQMDEEGFSLLPNVDHSESLLCVLKNREKPDYYKVEKLLFHWINQYEKKYLADRLIISPVANDQMLHLRKNSTPSESSLSDFDTAPRSPYSSSQSERAIALEFRYHHDNIPAEHSNEQYRFFIFYYYFPETKEIHFYFRRERETIFQAISKPLDIIINTFQQEFIKELQSIKDYFDFTTFTPSSESESKLTATEYQQMIDEAVSLDDLQSVENAMTDLNQNILSSSSLASLNNTNVQSISEEFEKPAPKWEIKEEELESIGSRQEVLWEGEENPLLKSKPTPRPQKSQSPPPAVTYSDDPMIREKPWKEPSPFEQRVIKLGMDAQKYKTPSIQEEAVSEMNKILSVTRKKGFYQAIKQYESFVEEAKEKNGEDDENTFKELEQLFVQGKKLSELNIRRLIERNAGEPSERDGVEDLSQPLQEKIALFRKIMSNQRNQYETSQQEDLEDTEMLSPTTIDSDFPQILDNDELVTPLKRSASGSSTKETNTFVSKRRQEAEKELEKITNPLERERILQLRKWARDKLNMLLSELEGNSVDLHPMILDGFRDLLLRDELIQLLDEAFEIETNDYRRSVLFPKIIDKTVSLYEELVALIKQESEQYLAVIRKICDISKQYQQNELVFLNEMDQIKHYFDVPFLQYLSYTIQQYEDYFQKQDVKLIKDPKLIELLQQKDQEKKENEAEDQQPVIKPMKGDKLMKARELFLIENRRDDDDNDDVDGTDKNKRSEEDLHAAQLKENYKWYHILQIIYNGVSYEFEHRYEILFDFLFTVIRFDNNEEIHKIFFQNIINTIPIVDLKYFQILCKNLISSILYNPKPSKEISTLIEKNPQIIRQMLILEQDIFCYCNDAIIEEKLMKFQDQLFERGERMILTHRNPHQQYEIDLMDEMNKRNLQTSFGYLKNDEERFNNNGKNKVEKVIGSKSKSLARKETSEVDNIKGLKVVGDDNENQRKVRKNEGILDDKQRFPPVYDQSQEKYSLSPTYDVQNDDSSNSPNYEEMKEGIESDKKKAGFEKEKKTKRRSLESRGYTKQLLGEEEDNPKKVSYYKDLEKHGLEELRKSLELEQKERKK